MKIKNLYLNGMYPAIHGMRNAYDSWDKSDTLIVERAPMTVSSLRVMNPEPSESTTPFTKSIHSDVIDYDNFDSINTIYFTKNEEMKEFNPTIVKHPNFERACYKIKKIESKEDKYAYIDETLNKDYYITCDLPILIGKNDIKLARKLIKGGPVHSKFERMIVLYMDLTASFDFWKEYDTYKVGTVANSCSTMHTITRKPLTIENFSTYDLTEKDIEFMKKNIEYYNEILNDPNVSTLEKTRRLSKLNMVGFEQMRTIEFNYCNIASIMRWRPNHTLQEWRNLCIFLRKLPYFEILYGDKYKEELEEENASTN